LAVNAKKCSHPQSRFTIHPNLKTPMRLSLLIWALVALLFAQIVGFAAELSRVEPKVEELIAGKAFISVIRPPERAGGGYKLVYTVDAPIEVFWRFKTDFDNNFLLTNKFIKYHKFISRRGNVVVTEDLFSENLFGHRPRSKFRWQTTLLPDTYRLDYILLNPRECGQKFHYGHIQIETLAGVEEKTMVTQIAYFDFFGLFFWINYPWYGGMTDFLEYTARWEQETILNVKSRYKKSAQ
jgi:hypothetical protein